MKQFEPELTRSVGCMGVCGLEMENPPTQYFILKTFQYLLIFDTNFGPVTPSPGPIELLP